MEQRSVLLRGIARVLNAGGSALLDIYDTATSIKTSLLPGEKGKLKAQLREYEKKIERLYYEIGKEVALREYTAQTSAAAEAKIKLVADCRVKIEGIKQSVREIEEREKAAARAATGPAGAKAQPAAHAGAQTASEAPVASEVSTGVVTEDITDILAEAETPGQKLQEETAKSGVPVAGGSSPGAETKQEAVPEALEEMLKSELLKICTDKGIGANERMTKAAIIELIKKGRI